MRKTAKVLLGAVGAAVLALGIATAPAHATAVNVARTSHVPVQVQGGVASPACSASYTEFGYTGSFKCYTTIMRCDWDGDGYLDEDFGIAPDRTIWHAWPGSGGWKEMPNNGKADDTWSCYWNGNGQRQVEVWVASGSYWYSYYSGGWKGWYRY